MHMAFHRRQFTRLYMYAAVGRPLHVSYFLTECFLKPAHPTFNQQTLDNKQIINLFFVKLNNNATFME